VYELLEELTMGKSWFNKFTNSPAAKELSKKVEDALKTSDLVNRLSNAFSDFLKTLGGQVVVVHTPDNGNGKPEPEPGTTEKV
jgi:uncharacterized membrane protein YgcG